MNVGINDKILCYLSPAATRAVEELKTLGLDQDLAVGVLERLWPEKDIYSISEEDEDRDTQ